MELLKTSLASLVSKGIWRKSSSVGAPDMSFATEKQ